MYLWKMALNNQNVVFEFTEQTEEDARNRFTDFFQTDRTYSKDEPSIKPIVEATLKLAKALDIDLSFLCNRIDIVKGFSKLVFIYRCGVFNATLKEGKIVLGTENGHAFTKEQFNAIFEFLDVLKQTNWLF